jgi:hypothetical protein
MSDGFLFPTPGYVLRDLLDERAQSDEPFSEKLAAADIMLALDRGDLKPVRYYARRWAWSKSKVHRHLDRLKTQARDWRQFRTGRPPAREEPSGRERDTGGTKRDSGGTSAGHRRDKKPASTPANAQNETAAGQVRDTGGTTPGQVRDSIEQSTEHTTEKKKQRSAGARGDGASTEPEIDAGMSTTTSVSHTDSESPAQHEAPAKPDEPPPADDERWSFLPERNRHLLPDIRAEMDRVEDGRIDLPMLARKHLQNRFGRVPTKTVAKHAREHSDREVVAAYIVAGVNAQKNPFSYANSILENGWTDAETSQRHSQRSESDDASRHRSRAGGGPQHRGGQWGKYA